MKLRLFFENPVSLDRSRAIFLAIAEAVRGAPLSFARVHHAKLEDRNGGGHTFEARWEAAGAVLSESLQNGTSGNPRDGWGYVTRYALRVDDVLAELTASNWNMHPTDICLDIRVDRLDTFDACRAAVANVLGAEAVDRTDAPFPAALNVAAAIDAGREDVARELLRRYRATPWARRPLDEYWIRKLDRLGLDLNGADPTTVARVIASNPSDLESWRHAAALGRAGDFDAADIALVLALFQPWSPRAVLEAVALNPHTERLWAEVLATTFASDGFDPIAGTGNDLLAGWAAYEKVAAAPPKLQPFAPTTLAGPEADLLRELDWPKKTRRLEGDIDQVHPADLEAPPIGDFDDRWGPKPGHAWYGVSVDVLQKRDGDLHFATRAWLKTNRGDAARNVVWLLCSDPEPHAVVAARLAHPDAPLHVARLRP